MGTVLITPNTFYNTTFTNVTTTAATTVWTAPPRRYWYRIERRECRLCGTVYERRERMDTPRPEKREDRVTHTFFYDYCG